jgi:methylphosphotriester-DNA--protein-cysteine methyltransferase
MKAKSFLLSIFILALLSLVSFSFAGDFKYVGSNKSDKYHFPNCKWALKIKPANLVTFQSAKEALAAKYVPCKVCKPPVKD